MAYILKRYSNRRLYDPQRGENITLDDVAELVRQSKKLKVVDNVTGNDITVRVISQAFLGTLKGWRDEGKSLEVLKVLISEGGETSVEILKKTMLASLGAFEVTRQKAEEIVDSLVQKGEIAKSERSQAVNELLDKAQESTRKFKTRVSEDITNTVERLKVARKSDLEALEAKVDQLIETVKKLEEKISPRADSDQT
jgi:poly(hydroxyalkanoate) granule-associated protein